MSGGHIGMSGGRICWSVHELGTSVVPQAGPWWHRQVRGGTDMSVVAYACRWWYRQARGGIGRSAVAYAVSG